MTIGLNEKDRQAVESRHDDSLLSSRTTVLLFEYMSEEAKANSFTGPLVIDEQMKMLGYGSND
jgi:hypothetical protein